MTSEKPHTPRFSFVLPSYNRAFCIKRAVDSLLHQKSGDFELIIVDDGSTDETEAIITKSYADEISRGTIRYVKTANGGVCKARNVGLSMAKGEWIAYLDSDNAIEPDYIETFERAIAEHPEAEAFYAKLEYMASRRIVGKPFDFEALRLHNFIDLGTYVHRNYLCVLEGTFDEKMTRLVDWELILRYSRRHTPVFIDKVLLHYDDSKETNRITNLGRSSYYVNLNYLRRKHCQDYPTVTTIVTTYNHEPFIAQALDSAISQEGRFIHEVLVSDDCSTDKTHDIVRTYAAKNPGLVFDISSGTNLGISENMRKCFAAARGKYIAVLEGDDYWCSSSKLQAQQNYLETNPDCSMVFCALKFHGPKGVSPSGHRYDAVPERMTGRDFFMPPAYMGIIANFSTCMFRTDLLRSLPENLYKYRLSEIALAFYLERNGYIGFLRDELTVYRQHAGGVWSGSGKFGQFLQRIRCREQVKEICREEYIPLVDADIRRNEGEFMKYFNHVVAVCHSLEKRVKDSESKMAGLSKKAESATKEFDKLKRNIAAREKEIRGLKYEVNNLKTSEAYRTGMFITWPARKAWGGVKCLRENGFKYTVKHAIGKVMRLFGSKTTW